jgi:hypothetical protein
VTAAPVLPASVLARLGDAVRVHYGSVTVTEVLGLPGQAALSRGDLAGVARLVRGDSSTETLIRLFLLGEAVAEAAAQAALHPLPLAEAIGAGLLTGTGSTVSAALDLRPYSESGGPDWWVLSDLAADVRPGPLDPEHVLGIGQAATTLAQATIRTPVRRSLDVGTGCGVQSLHLSRHSGTVTATDVSARALSFAAANAELNGLAWQLRAGSLLEPVAEDEFDLVVCNPPFIVGPGFSAGDGGFTYRDSGFSGDGVCERLVRGLPGVLAPGGTAQLLANWQIGSDGDWVARLTDWLPQHGVDAWIWQREVAEPGEYVSLWLRDAGEVSGSPSWRAGYDRWMDWFARAGVVGVGMGLISLRRTDSASSVVCEDVPQQYQPPIGAAIGDWFDRHRWLRESTDDSLLEARLVAAAELVLTTRSLTSPQDGWQAALITLAQSGGLRWELEVDEAVAGLVAACSGALPLGVLLRLTAQAAGAAEDDVRSALMPVVRDLIGRGFLVPDLPDRGAGRNGPG